MQWFAEGCKIQRKRLNTHRVRLFTAQTPPQEFHLLRGLLLSGQQKPVRALWPESHQHQQNKEWLGQRQQLATRVCVECRPFHQRQHQRQL